MCLAFLGVIVMVLLGCGVSEQLVALVQTSTPKPTNTSLPKEPPSPIADDCKKATNPTDQDVRYALGFAGNTFDAEKWDRSYTVQSMSVTVTWMSRDKSRVAFLEYSLYSCGFAPTDWDYVLADRTFRDISFRNYQNVDRLADCSQSQANLKLVEFTAQHSEKNYWIRFWASLKGSTRLLTITLVFPEESKTDLDIYGSRLFPALPSCSR